MDSPLGLVQPIDPKGLTAEIGGNFVCGSVVIFDLNAVTVDLASVPLDEVLDFRRQNLEAHMRYMVSVRRFAMALSHMPEEERRVNFEHRQGELDDLASDLRSCGRKAWKKPASFALSGLGAALSAKAAPVSSLIRFASSLFANERGGEADSGAYSYLFRARGRFGRY